ncbi:Rab guanine nucleotide exchange factor sec2 [Coniochaeta hoffmannii]|uniref:Rab guanine nucleotide exchange factor sec2 n=1 Tax=Coniochaeta hoffmannii TaxID=91930 RepID=A0AA38SHY0_9PEZI|nr:Rab guanine nucleotide exchange factor sec2 [Coniochaeta hoffmannii]
MANSLWIRFMGSVAWPSTNGGPRRFGHVRSQSAITQPFGLKPSSPGPGPDMAIEPPSSASPRLPNRLTRSNSTHSPAEDHDLSTIPDPRSRAMSPANGEGAPAEKHSDLDSEVTALSNKLINAINHQTSLDDSLTSARLELGQAQQKIRQLEDQIHRQQEMLAGDVWIRRKTAEAEKTQLLATLALEKKARLHEEQQRKKMELELESLTTALFEEANKMVIEAKELARQEQDALQQKNDLLRAQLQDTEGLLKSQQEQLSELKHVMETMNAELDDQTAHTGPSSPGFSKFSRVDISNSEQALYTATHSASVDPIPLSPSYPTSFSHLLQPVLNTDLAAFTDFKDLLRVSKRFSGHRISTGSQPTSLTGLGLGHSSSVKSTGSASSLSTAGTPVSQSAPHTPNTPASTSSMPSPATLVNLPPLKDTKFYKRALVEDIEPTLRLDLAPGLSWLARRTVLSAVTDGSLVVEPVPTTMPRYLKSRPPQLDPCSLCGEARKDEEHLRNHRFRTNESETAQRYPLCKYCLGRLRSTCDYLSFLRIVKDGHWHAEDEDAEKAAWEESVRLREQMFWSRIGGGVIPAAGAPAGTQTTVPPTPVTPAAPFVASGNVERDGKEDSQSTDAGDDETNSHPAKEPPPLPPRARPVAGAVEPTTPPKDDTLAEASAASDSGLDAGKPRELPEDPTPTPNNDPSDTEAPKRLSVTMPGAFDSSS